MKKLIILNMTLCLFSCARVQSDRTMQALEGSERADLQRMQVLGLKVENSDKLELIDAEDYYLLDKDSRNSVLLSDK